MYIINSFEAELNNNGFECYSFGSGSFDSYENKLNSNKDFIYIDITVDISEKEEIKRIYQEWKKSIK